MNKYIKLLPVSKKRMIWTCVLGTIFLLCVYAGIFQSYHYNREVVSLLILFVGVNSLIILRRLWFDTSGSLWAKPILTMFLLLTIMLTTVSVLGLQKIYYARQLENHSQIVEGEVIEEGLTSFHLYANQYAIVRYIFNDRSFIQKIDNEHLKLIEGERLKLRLSVRHPEILEIMAH